MKTEEQALNEFLAGIHKMIQDFSDNALLRLHGIIYDEIGKRNCDSEPTQTA